MIKKIMLGLAVVAFGFAGVAMAQQSGIKRTPLQKVDFPDGYNVVTAIAEMPAGGASAATPIQASKPVTCWTESLNSTSMARRRSSSRPAIPTKSRQARSTTPRPATSHSKCLGFIS